MGDKKGSKKAVRDSTFIKNIFKMLPSVWGGGGWENPPSPHQFEHCCIIKNHNFLCVVVI